MSNLMKENEQIIRSCLNFGSGVDFKESTKYEKWDNCDLQKEAPISFDFNKYPYNKLKNDYYDYVLIKTVLENLDEPSKALYELHKKSKNGAVIDIIAPYWNSKGAYNDPHSKRGFNEVFFKIVAERNNYYLDNNPRFKIVQLKFIPTSEVGRWIYPGLLRNKLSTFISGIISHIHVKLKVIK